MDDTDNHQGIILLVLFCTLFLVVFSQVTWRPSTEGCPDLKVIISYFLPLNSGATIQIIFDLFAEH